MSSNEPPTRTNNYNAFPDSQRYRECLFKWLAAHAPLWNQINYRRQEAYFNEGEDVWDAEYTDLYDDYAPILGKAACQQVARKNSEAWRSFFENLEKYKDENDPTVTNNPGPPGYWGNRDDGHELRGLVRNDSYEFDWGEDKSTLEFGVGDALKEEYGLGGNERLTLEVRGNPQWSGDDSRLELIYDDAADILRVKHPVRIQSDLQEQRLEAFTSTLDSENTMHSAAIDVGANNTLAIVTTTGETAVYHARPEFERFHAYTVLIGVLKSELPEGQHSSDLIQRLYDERGETRDHSRDAAVKHATEWLLERNVNEVYVGDLTGVLDSHWKSVVNEKTHAFWSHGQLLERINLTMGDVGITVEEVSEADSSSTCPACGSEDVFRDGDEFGCRECRLEAHLDVVGAWYLLQSQPEVGPMARPAALRAGRRRDGPENSVECDGTYWEWDEHDWRLKEFEEHDCSVDQTGVSEPASSQLG